jgi:antagonist of KipI
MIKAGEELKIDHPKIGCRCWLAISGGIDLPIVLESRSTDLRANFGGFCGRALQGGDLIPLGKWRRSAAFASLWRGRQTAATDRVSSWSAPTSWRQTARTNPTLRFVRGVHWDRFSDVTIQRFTDEPFTVSPDSDRMGVRLDGPELKRSDKTDLISEGVAPGTIQVPPGGKPILLLGDCQTIGGYPKIAHVITVDLGIAAQLRAGDKVRFREISLPDAHRLLLERERELELFRVGINLHFP